MCGVRAWKQLIITLASAARRGILRTYPTQQWSNENKIGNLIQAMVYMQEYFINFRQYYTEQQYLNKIIIVFHK